MNEADDALDELVSHAQTSLAPGTPSNETDPAQRQHEDDPDDQQTGAAGFDPPSCQGLLVVGATDRTGGRTSYSNYGRVHLSAPGGSAEWDEGRVLSTDNRGRKAPSANGYGYKDGTSMAAPLVSGVAALVLSLEPSLRLGEVHSLLESSARPFPARAADHCVSSGARFSLDGYRRLHAECVAQMSYGDRHAPRVLLGARSCERYLKPPQPARARVFVFT